MLLSREQAGKLLGRSPLTIRDWQVKHGLPVARREGRRVLYDSRAVLAMARQRRENYRSRSFIPGAGRGRRHPLTALISEMVKAGEKPSDIAEACSCSISTVYRVRKELRAVNST